MARHGDRRAEGPPPTDEAAYRELYHNANEGIILHDPETGAVLHVNDRLREMLGLSTDAEVELDTVVAGEAGFTVDRAREQVREAARDGRQVFEWLDETADGDPLWTEVSLQPITVEGDTYVMAGVRDISDRKAQERELADARRRLDETLERVEEGFFGLDEEWRVDYVNRHGAALLGVDREAVIGESVWEIFPGATGAEFRQEFERAVDDGEHRSFEAYADPLETWFEVHTHPDHEGLSVFFRDVTDRVERERELELYEAVFENVRERLFVLDGEGTFAFATGKFASWLGADRDTLLGASLSAQFGEAATRATWDAVVALDGPEDAATEETEVVADGERRDVELTATLLPEAARGTVLCSVRDVTDREAAERSRDALTANVPGMVYRHRFDGDGLAFASEACHDLTGFEASSLEGRVSWYENVVHPDDREAVRVARARAERDGESFTVTYRIVTAAARTRWVREYGRPVEEPDGGVEALEGILVEVTEEKKRERQRRVLNRVLRHNLRNEVQTVLGFGRDIERQAEGELASLAERVVAAGEELASLSEDAKYLEESIDTERRTRTVAVADTFEAVAGRHRERHPRATIDVAETAATVEAGERLETALDELVGNALVHNEAPTVELWAERDGDRVRIHVEDDGDGVPKRERLVLTGEREITQLDHGQGLGLWLAKWFVESYGGEFDLTTDEGTRVTLSLPAA